MKNNCIYFVEGKCGAMTNVRAALDRANLDVAKLWTEKVPDRYGFVLCNSNEVKIK